jgi:hydroxypyruvate reductase
MITFSPALYQREGLEGAHRKQIVAVLQKALEAVDPAIAVRRHLRQEGDILWVKQTPYELKPSSRVYVVGAGKAGAPMAQAMEEILGERITAGRVNVKYGYTLPTRVVELVQAGHPIPDEAGVNGARKVAALLQDVTADDLVLCLISGGGSALMTWPAEGLTLADMRALTDSLLRRGATINELNTIRKHLERLKGGGLARLAYPARLVSLILSDVVGNPLDVIASGPTVPDTSTFAQAYRLLERYALLSEAPAAVVGHLRRGAEGTIAETPKPGDPIFQHTQNVIIASNDHAARAAQRAAEELGFQTLVLSTYIEGEAREVAKVLAAIAREVLASGRPVSRPACIIAGGETTVTVKGEGKGGRNQEMALMAAMRLDGLDDVAIVCLATDGSDGPTDASGALADGNTVRRAAQLGLDPWEHLGRNDSYPFFAALGDLLLTGPTNTNVNDLAFVFAW